MTKYLILIMTAMLLWPVIPAMFYFPGYLLSNHPIYRPEEITRIWQQEAMKLNGTDRDTILNRLAELNEEFPDAEIFWVDPSGKTQAVQDLSDDTPAQWDYEDVLSLQMQGHKPGSFTLASLIGGDPKQGFMVMRLPKSHILSAEMSLAGNLPLILLFFIICLCFVGLSWLFFVKLRKRLIKLQSAMSVSGKNEIPNEVTISKKDEIGELEGAFNRMVRELRESQQREREEEDLRKQFISNVSHDLRTPLTVIRQHIHTVRNNPESSHGQTSLSIIERKLNEVDKLMDNLLSYSLLSAGKYPISMQPVDITEEVRNRVAEWYPVFEAKDFEVQVELPDEPVIWAADPMWLHRILDNVFQNVVRHAGAGRYIAVHMTDGQKSQKQTLIIRDRGPGISNKTLEKGAGIGLSIVSLMTKEMGMQWEMESSSTGCTFSIWKETK
ncbi:HAMP domain-containing sensor histidine kinase [Paenibacillus sp. FSL R5-0810]|uniref:HAMP domain-containing sensor histidine kinase n=1 Tax=Paenibacillus sp. FSL R5-0810 TaxID=2921659 RepID=UPI0030FA7E39